VKKKIKHTAGRWNPSDPPLYFLASNYERLSRATQSFPNVLIAVNEATSARGRQFLIDAPAAGKRLFIDSGVFNLTNEHARAHDVSMDVALGLAPDEIDGFDDLFASYCEIVREHGNDSWGYIEIDQGGRDNKIATRAKLEKMGFAPIPVYHPLNDGWDYFDELAQQYDRICFGNIVQADRETRKRLIATAWERRRKYPHLWIHLLGMTPNELLHAYPASSADSSGWLWVTRWAPSFRQRVCGHAQFPMPDFLATRAHEEADNGGMHKASLLGSYDADITARNWIAHLREMEFSLKAQTRGVE
jgi:hypothetical protein